MAIEIAQRTLRSDVHLFPLSACGEATDELGDENQNQPADRVTFEVAMRSTVLRL